MPFPRPHGYFGELFDFFGQTFTALSRDFKIFRIAFVASLLPAALILIVALCLPADTQAPWLGTALAIAVWLPLAVTLFAGVGGLFGAFWFGDLNRLQNFAAVIAGSLAFALATRLLPHKNWAMDFILLAALLLLGFAGGTERLRSWVFLLLAVEIALVFVPVAFPHVAYLVGNTTHNITRRLDAAVSKPMAINWNNPPSPFDPATGKGKFYYTQKSDGTYIIFDHPGYSQYDGSRLKHITAIAKWHEIVTFMRMRQKLAMGSTPPVRASVPNSLSKNPANAKLAASKPQLADPEPLDITTYHQAMMMDLTPPGGLWYTRDAGGTYRFFSSYGLDPVTRSADKLVTAAVARNVRKYFETVHWPNGPSRIRLTSKQQTQHLDFFPPGGLWYDRGGRFGYRLFNGPGTDPATGRTLKRLTPKIARELRSEFRNTVWPASPE